MSYDTRGCYRLILALGAARKTRANNKGRNGTCGAADRYADAPGVNTYRTDDTRGSIEREIKNKREPRTRGIKKRGPYIGVPAQRSVSGRTHGRRRRRDERPAPPFIHSALSNRYGPINWRPARSVCFECALESYCLPLRIF